MLNKILPNLGLPTDKQWMNILNALIFSFTSTFLAAFTAAGGIQSEWSATLVLGSSCLVSATNAVLYTLYTILFKKSS